MAKKVRKVKKKNTEVEPVITSQQVREKAPAAVKETPIEIFRQEYAYVVKDLRRVLFISGLMFVLLIVLNLVLR